ncbi:peroxiredoxin family protein [Candidatus Zixiibacteriota bacterium]
MTKRKSLAGMAGIVLMPLLITGLSACSKEAPAAAALEVLLTDYEASELGYNELRAAFFQRYTEIADTYWGTEAALKARLWILQTVTTADLGDDVEAPSAEEIMDAIFEEYASSPHMYLLADSWYMLPAEDQQERFSFLMENSPHAQVRASAIYVLATIAARGDATNDLNQRREDLLTELILHYTDESWNYSTYGEIAAAEMHPHDPADLEVGDRAPEITGTNVDGEEMKLSDYLGKVVVIDFWGDW